MQTALVVLSAVIAVELIVQLVLTGRMISILKQIRDQRPRHNHGEKGMVNYCVWTFLQGKWVLTEDQSLPGYRPSDPPSRPGGFPNESVRKLSVRLAEKA